MQLFLSRLSHIGLAGLLLLALALRWDVYPKTYFADELIPQAVIKHMQTSGTLDTNWENADWRGDFAGGFYKLKQYNFSSYHTVLYAFQSVGETLGVRDVPVLIVYRVFSVLCQLLAMCLVYFMAKHLYGDRAALCSAAFLAIAPQAVVDAHYARPESFVIFLVALACYLALKNCQQRKLSWVLLESSIWGVAFACKFSFFPMALLAFSVSIWKQQRFSPILLWLVGFVLGVAISAPYLAKDLSGFWHGIGLLRHQYAATDAQGGWWYFTSLWQLLAYLAVFFGIPIFLVMLAAGLQLQRAARLFFVLSALCSVFYLLLFSVQGVFFERNLSHLLPLWSVLFGAGADALLTRMKGRSALLLMKGLLCCCLVWLLFLSVSIDKEMFIGLEKNKNKIAHYEQALLQEFSATKIVALNVLNPASSRQLSSSTLLRVPMPKISSTDMIEVFLQKNDFVKIAAMEQPLAFLPYNQLQINQLPPAYAYYRKTGQNAEVNVP